MPAHDLETTRYCVFQCQGDSFALAAGCIRAVTPQPAIARVPLVDGAMIGLAYVHKEFVPVFDVRRLKGMPSADALESQQMLVISTDDCDFGLLIDRVLGLEDLEVSYAASRDERLDWPSVVCGSATNQDQFVSVLDPQSIARLLSQRLFDSWHSFEQSLTPAASAMPAATGV